MTVVAGLNTNIHDINNPPSNSPANLYYGRTTNSYEVAIPWAALGYDAWGAGGTCAGACRPAVTDVIRVAAYTTADENIGGSDWDIYDQSPGIGQGCNGLGCHEQLGDEWRDTDDNRPGDQADGSPFSGMTNPDIDQSGSDRGGLDVDTIESYFQLTLAPNDLNCAPSSLLLSRLTAVGGFAPMTPVVWLLVVFCLLLFSAVAIRRQSVA
jgi:hypothetical protein